MLRIRKYLHCSRLVPGPGLARVALRGLSPGHCDQAPLPSHAAAGGARAVPAPPLPQEPPAAPGHPASIHVAPQHPWRVPAEAGMLQLCAVLGCAWHPRVRDQAPAGSPQYCGWPAAMGPDPAAHHVPSTCICRGTACGVRFGRGPGAGVGALGARRAAVPGLFACLSRRLRVSSN